jgi:hypothetical protein
MPVRVHVHMNLYLGNRYRMTARSVTRANHMFSNTVSIPRQSRGLY